MTRLTFGVTSSPFLACQTLHQLAEDHSSAYPQASRVVCNSFYVDEWRAGSEVVINSIPKELREQGDVQELPTPSECHKTLDIHWDMTKDMLHVSTPAEQPMKEPTKRMLSSDVARTFDALGWYAPSVVSIKILLQHLWETKISWDEQIPAHIG